MKILLLISLTILASASLGERVCKKVAVLVPVMGIGIPAQSGNLIQQKQ